MNNTVLALVVGLVAGFCGAFVPTLLTSDGAADPTLESSADLKPLLERLDRIEALLENQPRTAHLKGSGANPLLPAEAPPSTIDALIERIDARVKATVKETVADTWKELAEESGKATPLEVVIPEKKKVTLAEAAKDLELSSYEESEIRRIKEETMEEALALMATDEDGGVETVRRDLDDAKKDPAKRVAVIGKYMGRLLGNLGGFIMLGQKHDRKMEKLIGKEKADRLDNEYELTDVDPYDLEMIFEGGFGD